MTGVCCLTPGGQVTIPRRILKSLEISEGNDLLIEVEDGKLVLKKVKANSENSESCYVLELQVKSI